MNDGGAITSHRRDPNNRLAQAFGCVVILCQVVLSEIAGAKLEPPKSLRTDSQSKGDYEFFAIASGLASSIDWNYYPPHEVPAMPLAPEPRRQVDPDEFYPK